VTEGLARLLLWISPGRFLRPLAISVVVALLTASAALIVSYLLFPVTGIEVKGARMFPESEAWEAVPDHASLLLLNLDALERRIKDNPWIKGVEMMKDWESGIVTVEVEERRAVLDGDLGGRRIVLSADGTELPGLGGAALKRVGLDEVQLEEILRIGEVLEENGVVLDSVDEVDARGIEATVEGRRALFGVEVGEGQARTLKGLMEQYPKAPYFDLRSPERVVIDARSGG
jgi:POTRA domain, FtsQ-type